MKGNNDNELKLIQDFLSRINNGVINNKNKAGNKFRELKQKVTNDRDTQRTFAPQDSSINLDDFTYRENYDELDEEDREMLRNMNKKGKGLKILTNKQMLNRLPILLAQIQAGNNSKKIKNELRQILYLLYRSKALTKNVYNNLIKVI